MGISGLHSVVRPYLRQTHLSEYKGRRVGCDAFAWLHRGACVCAAQLADGQAQQNGSGTPPWLEFCLNMIKMLLQLGVVPVVVMDGASLPAKAATQHARRERKRESLAKAKEAALGGDQAGAEALYAQTVDVTAEMAHELVGRLRNMGVDFLVAPYEADSQLAFLANIPPSRGGVAAVITEDSDLIAYGCARTLFKCDRGGHALELRLEDLFCAAPQQPADAPSMPAPLSFQHFTLDMLQAVCVLAGCDFLPSVKGVGVHKAHKLVKRYRMLSRAVTLLKDDRKLAVRREYAADAARAVRCFQHALVLDPSDRGGALTRLTPLPKKGASGQALEPEPSMHVARGVAYGYLHPCTHERFPDATASSQEGKAAGWLKAASKALSPFKPSITVTQPLSHVKPVPPPLISIADDPVPASPTCSGLTSEVPSPSEGQQPKLSSLQPAGRVQATPAADTGHAATPSTLTSRSLLPQLERQRMTEPEPSTHADAAVVISLQGCGGRPAAGDGPITEGKASCRSHAPAAVSTAQPADVATLPGLAKQAWAAAAAAAAGGLPHPHSYKPVAQTAHQPPSSSSRRKLWIGRCHSSRAAAWSDDSDADGSPQHATGAGMRHRAAHEDRAADVGLQFVAETAPWDDGADLPAWMLAGCSEPVTAAAAHQPPAAVTVVPESPCGAQQQRSPVLGEHMNPAQSAGKLSGRTAGAWRSPLQKHAGLQDMSMPSLPGVEGMAGPAASVPCSPLRPTHAGKGSSPAMVCDSEAGPAKLPAEDGNSLSVRQELAADAGPELISVEISQIKAGELKHTSGDPTSARQTHAAQPQHIAVDLTADENRPLRSCRQSTGGMQVRASPMWAYAAPSEPKPLAGSNKKRKSTGSLSAQQARIQRFFVPIGAKG